MHGCPQMRLVEDNKHSVSMLDIYKDRSLKRGMDHDNPIARFYEKLALVQDRGAQASHQVNLAEHLSVAVHVQLVTQLCVFRRSSAKSSKKCSRPWWPRRC